MESREQELFPHPSFREKQFATLRACLNAFEGGAKNVILDAPVGTGKSALCTALLRSVGNGFYSTPQKSLRQQIQDDEALQPYVEDLKARKDYRCSITGDNCKDCSIYNSDKEEQSCSQMACSYWKRKQAVMNSNIAVITFSMLIVDGMIPVTAGEEGMQISFDDRDMIVIDEAHGLVEQTREMHAGFDVTPYGLPKRVFNGVTDSVDWDASSFEDVRSECEDLKGRCKSFIREDVLPMNYTPEEQRCEQIVENINRAIRDTNNGSHWVVNVEGKNYGSNYVKVLELRPIYVGNFLNNFVWERGDKRVISTATLRQRKNPEIWVQQLGLDPSKTEIINVGMTFEPSNRPVILDEMVCSMSNNGDEKNWDSIMNKLDDITKRFHNQKGICHTASYDRAKEVEDTVHPEKHPYLHDNIFVHYGEKDASVVIEEWQASDNDLLLSPSMMEGIDLKDDKGRYNILMKVPYPSHDSVTNYLLNETSWGWNDYFDRAAVRVAQAYGRTTRSPDDWSNFFVLDKDYNKLKKKAQLPRWLLEAEGYEEIGGRSVFDY